MKTATISTTNIAYVDRGTGPVVLLIHGFPLDHTMWDPQIEALAERARVIAPDLRGFGKSPLGEVDSDRGITMEQYGDDLAEMLAKAGVEEGVTLVGFSMGGYVAWQFLRKHRRRVRSLVLCDTRAVADDDAAREGRLRMAEEVGEWGSERVFEMMKEKLLAPETLRSNGPVVEAIRRVVAGTDPAGIAAAQRGMAARPDVTGMLASIDLPTLVLCGAEDVISRVEEMRGIAEAIPNAEFVVIPDAGHMTTMENPARVSEALTRFVEAHG